MKKLFYTLCAALLVVAAGCCDCQRQSASAAAVVPKSITPPGLKMMLPEVIYAVPGIESNIYFANVVDTANINAYAVEVKCARGTHGNKTGIDERIFTDGYG